MTDVVSELEAELDEATGRAKRLVDSIDARIFTIRPHPNSWSAAECIAHLSLTSESYLPLLRTAIDQGRAKGMLSAKMPKMDLIGRVLRWFLEPPIRTRVKTTVPFVPRSVRAKSEAFAEFSSLQKRIAELLHEARGLDLAKLRIVSPFDTRMKYNFYSAMRILTAHERRHLWQAEQAVEEIERQYVASAS